MITFSGSQSSLNILVNPSRVDGIIAREKAHAMDIFVIFHFLTTFTKCVLRQILYVYTMMGG